MSRGEVGLSLFLTYLLWFRSPHILTYTFTHPVPAAALRMGVFQSKTPVVIFSPHITLFYLKLRISKKEGVMPPLPHGLLLF